MRTQKIVGSLFLSIVLVFGIFLGCGDDENPYSPPEERVSEVDQPIENAQPE